MTPLEMDILSIVESKPGMLIINVRYFFARSKYPSIKITDVMNGTDGINECIRGLKKQGYLKMKDYRRLYVTDKWRDEQKGGEHV